MDERLNEISLAVKEINRNLTLFMDESLEYQAEDVVQSAVVAINHFESEQMHRIRQAMEDQR